MLFAELDACTSMSIGMFFLFTCVYLVTRKAKAVADKNPEVGSAATGVAIRFLGKLFK